ncbi:YafY family protein [Desulfonatronum sp. SC1]|uniref:helix-turn-helix transcriptional regulator n=1 Tax=Desulfonatronum sp. SC1 TaxID=2109626 RepID=UPI000D2FA322|nr:WYL domain-containing transcriptional regulator [Desulfonatronum sp. SC1]PTN39107.1 transcriptional regulator [Desulfonatronum sp. SC1]
MRGKILLNLLNAIELLSRPQGATIQEIGESLGLQRRSVYRLLAAIQDLGFPVYDAKGEAGATKQWKMLDDYVVRLPNITLPKVELTPSEAMAIQFMAADNRLPRAPVLRRNLDQALAKLSLLLPRNVSDSLRRFSETSFVVSKLTKDYSQKEVILDDLTEAMLTSRMCEVDYHAYSTDQTKTYAMEPLSICEHDGGLYLFVRISRYEEIRLLAVERIRGLRILESSFDYPDDFDPQERLKTAFGVYFDDPVEITIRFSPEVAKYVVDRKWSGEQRVTMLNNGGVELWMRTSGKTEVLRWVLGFGPNAEVLAPAELRNEVKVLLKKALQHY